MPGEEPLRQFPQAENIYTMILKIEEHGEEILGTHPTSQPNFWIKLETIPARFYLGYEDPHIYRGTLMKVSIAEWDI